MAPAGVEEAGGVGVPLGAGAVFETPPAVGTEVVLLAPGDAVPLGTGASPEVSEDVALSLLVGVTPLAVLGVVGVWLLDLRVEAPTSFLKRVFI